MAPKFQISGKLKHKKSKKLKELQNGFQKFNFPAFFERQSETEKVRKIQIFEILISHIFCALIIGIFVHLQAASLVKRMTYFTVFFAYCAMFHCLTNS